MFRVKICGITNLEDALGAVDVGADAIGLNFYAQSPRSVSLEQAAGICNAVRGQIKCVGVFVNHDHRQIRDVCQTVGLDGVQLHGDEPPELAAKLSGEEVKSAGAGDAEAQPTFRPIRQSLIRVRRMPQDGVAAIAADLAACRAMGARLSALLVDAYVRDQYGGSGATVRWEELSDYERWIDDLPLILAGGLTPVNVAEAISVVRPHGVDVASGVESSPGRKDPAKVRAFVVAAQQALLKEG